MMVCLSGAKFSNAAGPLWPGSIGLARPINPRGFQADATEALWVGASSAGTRRLLDVTGRHHGELVGSVSWLNDPQMGPVLAGTSSGRVDVSPVTLLWPVSISLWFRLTANDTILIGMGNTSNVNTGLQIEIYDGVAYFYVKDDSGVMSEMSGGSNYNDGQWHLVTAVRASATSRLLYVDGVAVASSTTAVGTTTFDRSSLGARFNADGGGVYVGPNAADIGLAHIVRRAVGPIEQWQRFAPQTRWDMLQSRRVKRFFVMGSTGPSSPIFRRTLFGRSGSRGVIAC